MQSFPDNFNPQGKLKKVWLIVSLSYQEFKTNTTKMKRDRRGMQTHAHFTSSAARYNNYNCYFEKGI